MAAYCRTSTENQKSEQTIELQVASISQFAKDHGIVITSWFKDDGVSGGLAERAELIHLMDYLENESDVQGVIIYKLDRLARDLYIQEGIIKELTKLNKEIISTLEPDLGSNDPFRNAFRQMLGVFAEFEKAMITLRMKNGRESAVSKGRWHGGLVFGYDHKQGQLVINQKEAEIVKKIFYLNRYKKQTSSYIAKELNRLDVPTKTKKGKWRNMTVEKILNNKIYRGQVLYRGKFYKGKHESIIN